MAVSGEGRARPQQHGNRDRRTAAEVSFRRSADESGGAAAPRADRARRDQTGGGALALFLLGLSAQSLDRDPRGRARLCRHRLPFHGAIHGSRHRRLYADGRRGRQLGRRGAFLHARPRLPEPRRRHLQPLRRAGVALGDRFEGQRHLQDPVQRRRRDDRRPTPRRRPHRAADRAAGLRRRRQAGGRRRRRSAEISRGHAMARGRHACAHATS